MKHTRKLVSILLVLVLALALAVPAFAAGERGVLTYEEVIAPEYEMATDFFEGLAAVKKDGKWGYIDTDNNVVIPFEYDIAYAFHEGYAVVGKPVTDVESEREGYSPCEMGFVEKTGAYHPLYNWSWSDDLFIYWYPNDMDWAKWSPLDYVFQNGYLSLSIPGSVGCGHYDTTGRWADLGDLGDGTTWQVNEGVAIGHDITSPWAPWLIDVTTGERIKVDYDFGWRSGGGDDFSIPERGIDYRPANQGLIPAETYDIVNDGSMFGSPTKRLLGFLNRDGSWTIQPQFTSCWVSGLSTEYRIFGENGLASVEKDGKWGAIDKTGTTVTPFVYEGLRQSKEGMIAFQSGGKWGFLDAATLTVVIPARYDDVTDFLGGFSVVKEGDSAHLIDRKGNGLPGGSDLSIGTYFKANGSIYNPDEYTVIERNGKYGYGHVSFAPALPEKSEMDDWAHEEVTAAIQADLVPVSLQTLYHQNITRAEFCDLAVAVLEAAKGKDIDAVVLETKGATLDSYRHLYPFTDTAGKNILACYALGIVNGRGNGIFDPYASISRQEAAKMLHDLSKVLGVSSGQAVVFVDASAFPTWAAEAIEAVSGMTDPTTGKAVMGGTGDGSFAPTATYTREQAYLTVLRLFNATKN